MTSVSKPLDFAIPMDAYLALAKYPFDQQLVAETVQEILGITPKQAQQFVDLLALKRNEWAASKSQYQQDRAKLGLGSPRVMLALGLLSTRAANALMNSGLGHRYNGDLIKASKEDFEEVNWKETGNVGEVTRTELAKIYAALGMTNETLETKAVDVIDVRAEAKRIMQEAGIKSSVIESLFGEASSVATSAQQEAAEKILKGNMRPAQIRAALNRTSANKAG